MNICRYKKMISPACMCRWGTAIVQTDVLRDRASSETLCLYGCQTWVDFHRANHSSMPGSPVWGILLGQLGELVLHGHSASEYIT